MNQALLKAREYEEAAGQRIPPETRPVIHLSPRVGWMNDPNGFSVYRGEYHLFYQYYPYATHWGPIHWGHAVSRDLISWKYLPAAMAPDEDYDRDGCFSGSAIEMPDGRQMLLYTGYRTDFTDAQQRGIQTQNLAFGDGRDYRKYPENPVIDVQDRPEGGDPYNFRDPKIWRTEDGVYRAVIASRNRENGTQILLYESGDGIRWRFLQVLYENHDRIGKMWECPDLFPLDGQDVLIASAMDMTQDNREFHPGNNEIYLIGKCHPETGDFREVRTGTLDHGMDLYAAQTTVTSDGRRVLIGWMQNPDTSRYRSDLRPIFGQMSIPRELHVKDGRLYQWPVKELERYRTEIVSARDVPVRPEERMIDGIRGRVLDLEVSIRPEDDRQIYREFRILFGKNGEEASMVSYEPRSSIVRVSRDHPASRRETVVTENEGKISIRLILDRFSAEVFINQGEKVLSFIMETDPDAEEISFQAEGKALMDVIMYRLDSWNP